MKEIDRPYNLFYEEGLSYYKSGVILQNSPDRIQEEDLLFSPIVYLLRHALELLFKALIVKDVVTKNKGSWNTMKFPPENRRLNTIHSIKTLYETWKLMCNNVTNNDEEGIDEIENIVEQLDSYDFSSTFFRYPYSKEGEVNRKRLTEEVDEDILTSVPCSLGAFIYHEGPEKFACLHREQMMDCLEEDLVNVIEYLIAYYKTIDKD